MASPTAPNEGRVIVLFRVRGIEIAFTPSWLIMVTLVALYFQEKVLPHTLGKVASAGLSVLLALVFYVFVLLHEGAHTMVASAFGLQPRRIVLFMLGGVSQISRDAETPKQEYMVALAGPLMSLVLAGLLAMIAHLKHQAIFNESGVWGTLALINALLAVFNLIPGFPLDGGRVFRSTIWAINGNRVRATQIAVIGGRLVGAGLAAAGFATLLFSSRSGNQLVDGAVFMILGWFLYSHAGFAGSEEIEREQIREHARMEADRHAAAAAAPMSPLVADIVPESKRRRGRSQESTSGRMTPDATTATLERPKRTPANGRTRGAKQGAPALPAKEPSKAAGKKPAKKGSASRDEGNASKPKADRRAGRSENRARSSEKARAKSGKPSRDSRRGSSDARGNAGRKR